MIPLSLKNMKVLLCRHMSLISVLYAVSMVPRCHARLVQPSPTIPLGRKVERKCTWSIWESSLHCRLFAWHIWTIQTFMQLLRSWKTQQESVSNRWLPAVQGYPPPCTSSWGPGYAGFGNIVEDNILLNYINLNWTNTVLFNTCRVAMVMCLVVSYPLILFPCRMCLHALLKDALPESLNTSVVPSISNGNVSDCR